MKAAAIAIFAATGIVTPTAAHAASPSISCSYAWGHTTCHVRAEGGYCGSSRPVGVGVTTARKGGITVTSPAFQTKSWNAGATRNHKIVVGTTYAATVTLEGNATERPYVTCSF